MFFGSSKRNRRKSEAGEARLPLKGLAFLFKDGFRPFLGLLAIAGGGSIMLWGVTRALDRPIGKVEVDGKFQRVAPVQIEEAIRPFRGEGFLSVNLDAMRAALQTIPWVDHARVERRWPNGVHVFITEHVAAARWGEDGLMNTRGELFLRGASHIPPELPQLIGPEGTESEVAHLYLETYPRLLSVGLRLTRVELDPRGAWQLSLQNGVQVRLGRQNVNERLERFIRVASPVIAARASEVNYVDLRYSNGFSVGWNAPTRVAHDSNEMRPDA
ncbi:MAG TPA: cell division protein FtsQ/DivIB [Steroidobacteraceae bacterium]|nr:cell division protein FtsQ/DivIB [Steroidobacteraceae bacterium]